ncbi:MAG TPA: hypothetical protein VMT31_08105 [Methanomicrobiales archaeon]|jgi:hypothetical protein|nr:hypothetical protein [Methanomicrobiales archaeon]
MAEEELFDVLVPPGVPKTIIIDIVKKFDVQVVERKMPLYFANMDGTEREILAFRGKLAVVQQVEKYLKEELAKFIETGSAPRYPRKEPEKAPE